MRFAQKICSIATFLLLPCAALAHGPGVHGPVVVPQELDRILAASHSHQVCFHQQSVTQTLPVAAVYAALRQGAYLGPCMIKGDRRSLGEGEIGTYAQMKADGTPYAIGFMLGGNTLRNLPATPSDGETCFDKNGDGQIDVENGDECVGGHAFELDFPYPVRAALAPFGWALANWNPQGHGPGGIYDVPHFDFHFYTQPLVKRNLIRPGSCGALMNCDDLSRAGKPVPGSYMPAGYVDVGAVEARMGNHLIAPAAPEFNGFPFSSTFIFGAYDGQLTFWEPMVRLDLLHGQPFFCHPIAQASAYLTSGNYPRQYCVKYYAARNEYQISLEDFSPQRAGK